MRYCEKHGVRMETPEDVCKFCASEPVETDELASLRARIAAAIALCEEIERDHGMDVAHSRGHGMVDAAEAIRETLEET